MIQLTDYEQRQLNILGNLIHNGDLSNNFLVSNLKLIEDYLGLKEFHTLQSR